MSYIYKLAKEIYIYTEKKEINTDSYEFKNIKQNLMNYSRNMGKFFLKISKGYCNFTDFPEDQKHIFLKKWYFLVNDNNSYLKNDVSNNKLLSNLCVYKNDNINLELLEFDLMKDFLGNLDYSYGKYILFKKSFKDSFLSLKYRKRNEYLEGQEINKKIDTTTLIEGKINTTKNTLKKEYLKLKYATNLNQIEKLKSIHWFFDLSGDFVVQFIIKVLINDKIITKKQKIIILESILKMLKKKLEEIKINSKLNKINTSNKNIIQLFYLLINNSNSKYMEILNHISKEAIDNTQKVPGKYFSNERYILESENERYICYAENGIAFKTDDNLIEELTFGEEKRTKYYKKNKEQFEKNIGLTEELMKLLPGQNRELYSYYLQHFRGVYRELHEVKNTLKQASFKSISKKLIKEITTNNLTEESSKNNLSEIEKMFFGEILSKAMFIEGDKFEEYLIKNKIQDILSEIDFVIYSFYDENLILENLFKIYNQIFNSIKEICSKKI